MNKKGNTALKIVLIGAGILILIAIIITFMIIINSRDNKKEEKVINETMTLFLIGKDKDTSNQISADYVLDYGENNLISSGKLKDDSFNEIDNVPNYLIHAYCWNEDHYLVKASKIFSDIELANKKASFSCDMDRIGRIEVNHFGNIDNDDNIIKFNITADGNYYKLSACFEWGGNIISAIPSNYAIRCDYGNWTNYSYFNESTKEYSYYPKDYYGCNDRVEKCDLVQGDLCKPYTMDTPERYLEKVDSCHYFGITLRNNSYQFELTVRRNGEKTRNDFIKIYFMDNDRRFSDEGDMWIWVTEKNGENIGAEDTEYEIRYGE